MSRDTKGLNKRGKPRGRRSDPDHGAPGAGEAAVDPGPAGGAAAGGGGGWRGGGKEEEEAEEGGPAGASPGHGTGGSSRDPPPPPPSGPRRPGSRLRLAAPGSAAPRHGRPQPAPACPRGWTAAGSALGAAVAGGKATREAAGRSTRLPETPAAPPPPCRAASSCCRSAGHRAAARAHASPGAACGSCWAARPPARPGAARPAAPAGAQTGQQAPAYGELRAQRGPGPLPPAPAPPPFRPSVLPSFLAVAAAGSAGPGRAGRGGEEAAAERAGLRRAPRSAGLRGAARGSQWGGGSGAHRPERREGQGGRGGSARRAAFPGVFGHRSQPGPSPGRTGAAEGKGPGEIRVPGSPVPGAGGITHAPSHGTHCPALPWRAWSATQPREEKHGTPPGCPGRPTRLAGGQELAHPRTPVMCTRARGQASREAGFSETCSPHWYQGTRFPLCETPLSTLDVRGASITVEILRCRELKRLQMNYLELHFYNYLTFFTVGCVAFLGAWKIRGL